jgi:SAM-dependent methyltransferase
MSGTQAIDWESRYRDGTTGWERPGLNPAFLAWRESGALSPCRILVPGGGRSVEPVALAEAGFDVTVVDAAASAVAAQRARMERLHVQARVEQADLFAWTPDAPFDAVYDQTCLCSLPPATWPEYATRLHHWLRPGGRLFVLFMQTGVVGGPPFHCDMDDMRLLFRPIQWDWPDELPAVVAHSPGRVEQPAVLRSR